MRVIATPEGAAVLAPARTTWFELQASVEEQLGSCAAATLDT
jgi:hypothetical protein